MFPQVSSDFEDGYFGGSRGEISASTHVLDAPASEELRVAELAFTTLDLDLNVQSTDATK